MIAIIDYGMGNLRSVQKAIEKVGYQAIVTCDPEEVKRASGVILPGVGAFGDAMYNLKHLGMIDAIKKVVKEGTPFLGICLGMQLLFSTSEEHGMHVGLNLIPGHVRRFKGDFKIPHMGWNSLTLHAQSPILEHVKNGDYVYFVHSYYVEPMDRQVILASADYHGDVPAIVQKNNVFGIQFHPEKSSHAGLQMLTNFAKLVKDGVHA
ncbi:imidazole glycerol phosphate synthase subunit HisH [Collibacillus ludicampi]|uniref:Imidazole glycerol phosphate synthase subunit HisH n=1 Tax=Collibacillus ludicampi TaxID=2771369 RepID=A0AAV4LBU6_9BACL|nr:imidazole glycerol phosphate synthase subunit HisH [Collibacillus ludicampi]GIM45329.1 imidazole glycerol phosphate synthase subunit HisH [Collibacillus ludicampi]